MEKENKEQDCEIISRTHRIAKQLYNSVSVEANKTGNAINSEINNLILDGLRFRNAKVVIHLEDV